MKTNITHKLLSCADPDPFLKYYPKKVWVAVEINLLSLAHIKCDDVNKTVGCLLML